MNKTATLLFLILTINISIAQITVKGKVIDNTKNPIEFVIVSIQLDSTIITNQITDSVGNYEVKNLKKGFYKFKCQHVAYESLEVSFYLKKDTIIDIQYQDFLKLPEVTVVAKKPILERKLDRIRFNVANTDIVFGNSIWEVIGKTPLVNTSEGGDIEISGTTGVIVYINNRKKILSGASLKNYLNSIPSKNLEAIEVITTPPSKYDAEGGAGIINIVLKKNKKEGLVGNIGLSGRKTKRYSEASSLYLNYRKGKWNVYSDMYISNRERQALFKKDIFYPISAQPLDRRSIKTVKENQIVYPGINTGIDYEINSKHIIGVLLDYSGSRENENRQAISNDFYTTSDSLSVTDNIDKLTSETYSINLNYQAKLDTLEKILTVDLDAFNYSSTNKSTSKTDVFVRETNTILYNRSWFRSSSPQQINNQSIKLDFESPLTKKISFETGVKASFSEIDNNLIFENRITNETWEKDTLRSNLFKYKENINSFYAIINHKLNDKWGYQLGTRIEYTITSGWLEGKRVVDEKYINIFPTVFLRYKANTNHSFVLAVTSRITRPNFWDVNPFRLYTTDQTYFEGNPFLKPSKYYRQEFNFTYHKNGLTLISQTGASQLLDEFYALPFNPSGDIIANRKTNYGNKYSFFETVSFGKKFFSWWRFSSSILAAYILSKGEYANNIEIDNKSSLLSISVNQAFRLSKKKGLSLSVIARNTLPVTIVNTRIKNRLQTELKLRKSIGNLNISLSARDLFKSNKDRYNIQLDNLQIIDNNYHDTQSVAIALSYDFGKLTVKNQRNRAFGNKTEQQRL